MHRFYLPSPNIDDHIIEIKDTRITYQVAKVLRMRPGKHIFIFDENQNEYKMQILELNQRKLLGNIIESIKRHTEPRIEVNLYQAIPKKTALFEWVLQKATEIGVSSVFPMVTERTQKHRMSKFDRLQKIAIEATEQSRRLKVPVIRHPVEFSEVISKVENSYLAYEYEEEVMLNTLLQKNKSQVVNLFIGPEGGFTQKEIDVAIRSKANLFSLGSRILRMETAAISALSLILLQNK